MFSQATIMLAFAASSCLVSGQFLPQSHLSRLVQSITSPLVLSSGSGDSSSAEGAGDNYANPSASYYSGQDEGQEVQSQAQARPQVGSRYNQYQGLQQAPSQQRGTPQHYYGGGHNQQQDSDEGRDHGGAPSNHKGTHESYQMGAYLGPTIDDKEINGVFNSNDDRDDDDGPASYDGLGGSGRAGDSSSYGPQPNHVAGSASSGYERQPAAGPSYGPAQAGSGGYDDDSADEDDSPNERARGNLNQAASHYRQQGSAYNQQANQQPLMAAANGYAPYGFSGPVDLTGFMNGNQGPEAGNFQAYNGDGSYPGQNYYQQQQQPQRGARSQAASMNSGYYNNQNQNGGRQAANSNSNDNDEHEHDSDDD